MCVIVVIKAIRVTPTFVGCAFCTDRSEHLPWWRRSVLAPVCLWKYLFCTEVGRDSRGQRWCRSSVFAHAEMFFFLLSLYWPGGSGARKLQSFTLVFEWGSLTMQAHFQIPIPTTHIFIKAQGHLFIHERVCRLCVANPLSVDPCHYGSPSNKQLEAH